MDGNSSTDHDAPPRDLLLYHNGHAYSLLAEPQGGCYRPQKLGTRENYRGFLENIVRDLAMRHRLWLQALYWAAYFGEGVGHDFMGWLTEALFTGRLGLYEVVCSGPPRGEPRPLDEKQVRAAVSAAADNTPWVAPIKSALQMVTGADVVTDAPVNRWVEGAGVVAGLAPGGKAALKMLKRTAEKRARKAQLKAGRPSAPALKGVSYQLGKSDGGPGTWAQAHTPGKGSAYQQQVTGAPRHVEYAVPARTPSGKIKFDGYDPQRKVLIDAKDWDKWPPVGEKWAEKSVIKKLVGQARDQATVGKQTGHSVEWHVPTQQKAAQVAELLEKEGIKGIKLVVTPK